MKKKRLSNNDFLTLMDFDVDEIIEILDLSDEFKILLNDKTQHEHLRGKNVALFFEKPSTRTRLSFMAAISHLGARSFNLNPQEMQISRGEPLKDTARVIDRCCDALVMRTFEQERLEEFARYMEKPVINALSNESHPCQCLADLMTIRQKKKRLKGLKLMYTGDVSNVVQSLLVGGSMTGMDIFITVPERNSPDKKYLKFAREHAIKTGSKIVLTSNIEEGLEGADIVYANTWTPMHLDPALKELREKSFKYYQINEIMMKKAQPNAIFMHCLPAFRNKEITDEVIEGPWSVVWDQVENRLHTEKAVLSMLLG